MMCMQRRIQNLKRDEMIEARDGVYITLRRLLRYGSGTVTYPLLSVKRRQLQPRRALSQIKGSHTILWTCFPCSSLTLRVSVKPIEMPPSGPYLRKIWTSGSATAKQWRRLHIAKKPQSGGRWDSLPFRFVSCNVLQCLSSQIMVTNRRSKL